MYVKEKVKRKPKPEPEARPDEVLDVFREDMALGKNGLAISTLTEKYGHDKETLA